MRACGRKVLLQVACSRAFDGRQAFVKSMQCPFARVTLVQFGTLDGASLVAGMATGRQVISGNLRTPRLTSRTSRMNTVVLLVDVRAFGWLWGLWGLLLGVPVLAAVKAVGDRVDDFSVIGDLLGD